MPSKTLKASVKLDVSNAEKALKNLEDHINRVDRLVNKSSSTTNGLDKAFSNAANSSNKMHSNVTKTSIAIDKLTSKVKRLAATYLGVMGAKAMINTSDLITSAENKIGNVTGYDPKATQDVLDKTYAAAQRSRSGYTDMLSNVSKSITLAGDAFQNNVDNAVRFQEIMAKAYTIGGASAAEKSSSMYQLVQALGSGTLQGDELRSVREGAAFAYKEIEKFAQGVFNTELSLKELASQGLITSDIVVAAIMNAEDKINKAFDKTHMTFAQMWDNIKNMGVKAFEPVLQSLNDMLNALAKTGLLDLIGATLVGLGQVIGWLFGLLTKFFQWFADNWYWLQYVVYAVITLLIIHLSKLAAQAIITGITMFVSFLKGITPLQWTIILIGAAIAAIVYLANTTATASEFMIASLFVVAIAIWLIGIVTQSTALLIAAVVVAVIAVVLGIFMECGQDIMGTVYVIGSFIGNCLQFILNSIVSVLAIIATAVNNIIVFICNLAVGLWKYLEAIGTNIGIAMSNPWEAAKAAFWEWVANVIDGIKWLEPIINAVAKAFGAEGFTLSEVGDTARANANAAKNKLNYVDPDTAFLSGFNTFDRTSYTDAWKESWGVFGQSFEDGWASNAWNNGVKEGERWQNWLNKVGSSMKDGIANFDLVDTFGNLMDKVGDKLNIGEGLDNLLGGDMRNPIGSGLPNVNDPALALSGAYDPNGISDDIAKGLEKLGSIDEDTSKIKDSMDLTQDDLEYLRKIAEMEWRNEFTTAEIKVEMTNNNSINSERDWEGMLTYLSDRMREEAASVAYGVHTR